MNNYKIHKSETTFLISDVTGCKNVWLTVNHQKKSLTIQSTYPDNKFLFSDIDPDKASKITGLIQEAARVGKSELLKGANDETA